jgi:hypothetical protein
MSQDEQEMFVYLMMNGWEEETDRPGMFLKNGRGGAVARYHFKLPNMRMNFRKSWKNCQQTTNLTLKTKDL